MKVILQQDVRGKGKRGIARTLVREEVRRSGSVIKNIYHIPVNAHLRVQGKALGGGGGAVSESQRKRTALACLVGQNQRYFRRAAYFFLKQGQKYLVCYAQIVFRGDDLHYRYGVCRDGQIFAVCAGFSDAGDENDGEDSKNE